MMEMENSTLDLLQHKLQPQQNERQQVNVERVCEVCSWDQVQLML